MKRKDLIKLLEANGFRFIRNKGHAIYKKEGQRSVQVPNHREIAEDTAKQILKDAGLA